MKRKNYRIVHRCVLIYGHKAFKSQYIKDCHLTSKTFKWDEQINVCISKGKQSVAWVTRNLILRDKKVILDIYKTIVRPHLGTVQNCGHHLLSMVIGQ